MLSEENYMLEKNVITNLSENKNVGDKNIVGKIF